MSDATTLLLSARDTVDRRLMSRACADVGQPARALESWRVPPELTGRSDLRLYAEALFAEVVAGPLGLALLDPADDWLVRLPWDHTRRTIVASTLGGLRTSHEFPVFAKAQEDKLGGLPGKVFAHAGELPDDLPDELPILVAPPVAMSCELRLFCVEGEVLAGSGYWRDGAAWQQPLEQTGLERRSRDLAMQVWEHARDGLPSAYALDVALVEGQLVVVEANGAWGAGLYARDPVAALPCILAATLPRIDAGSLPPEIVRCPTLDG